MTKTTKNKGGHTIYFDNDVQMPKDLTPTEADFWRSSVVGRASIYVPTEIWEEIRNEALRDVMYRRARGVR